VPDWQTAAGGHMSFEVAAIHLSKPENFAPPSFALSADDSFRETGGNFHADFPLLTYIEFAYKIWPTREQASAMQAQMPRWAASDRFAVSAKAPIANPTKDQYRLMVQALLAERFKLAVHFEERDMPVLAMTLDKPGKLGPKLKPHSEGAPCEVTGGARGLDTPTGLVFPGACGTYAARLGNNGMWLGGSRNTTMDLLASYVAMSANQGRPVVDRTGLTGRYDFTLESVPEQRLPGAGEAPVEGPTFLEALKDQLGLKLTPARATVRTLLVDHVEALTEN
jgi:uncharacterized protein (TIGR03435 family)